MTDQGRGTASYRAPELLRPPATFDESVDIWALGCVLFELVSGQKAFNDDWYVQVYSRQDENLPVPLEAFVHAGARVPLTNLVHNMLSLVPDRRPRARDVRSVFDFICETGSFEPPSEAVGDLFSRICKPSANLGQVGSFKFIVFSVPYERNPYFAGRDDLLDTLFLELKEKRPNRYNHRIALYGLGGVGKTQVVLEYAYRHQSDYAYIFWISGVDRAELLSGFSRVARILRCGMSLTRREGIAKRVLQWLEVNESWLLIVDNVDDVDVIAGYLPQSDGSGHTIITTRNTNTAGIPAPGLEVQEMDRDSGVLFLLQRLGAIDPSTEIRGEVYQIVDAMGGLPLAIEQAAGYIKIPENIFTYLSIFNKSRRQLLGRPLVGNHIYTRTVLTTWEMSFARLQETRPDAVTLLQYLAFMNADEILVDYLRAGVIALPSALGTLIRDPFEWGEAINALQESSLIRVSSRDTKLSIHRLLQAVVQDGLEPATRKAITSVLLLMGEITFPKLTESRCDITICRKFRSQIVACLEHTKSSESNPSWIAIAERLAHFLYLEGMYSDASYWWGLLLSIRKETFEEEHENTLRCKFELARSWDGEGRNRDASLLNEDTLAIGKRVLGPEHPLTLDIMNSLACSYYDLGRYEDASGLYAQNLDLRLRVHGREDPKVLEAMHNLACSYRNLGQLQDASDLHAETLNLTLKVLGPEHPHTAVNMHNLALAYHSLGQFEEAAQLFADTSNLQTRVLGPEHPDTLRSMNALAVSLLCLGRLKQALDLHVDTFNIQKRVLGADHPSTLRTLACLEDAKVAMSRMQKVILAQPSDTKQLNPRTHHPQPLSVFGKTLHRFLIRSVLRRKVA